MIQTFHRKVFFFFFGFIQREISLSSENIFSLATVSAKRRAIFLSGLQNARKLLSTDLVNTRYIYFLLLVLLLFSFVYFFKIACLQKWWHGGIEMIEFPLFFCSYSFNQSFTFPHFSGNKKPWFSPYWRYPQTVCLWTE